jgi:hypothetical protein
MTMLADANKAPAGRWVVTPDKGQRFMGPRDRGRARARARRKQIFMVLLESTVLSLIIGLFPPLRLMLVGTGVLAGILLVYTMLLVKLAADERARDRMRRDRQRRFAMQPQAAGSVRSASGSAANGHARAGHARQTAALAASASSGPWDPRLLQEGGVHIVEDDVHVIVRPARSLVALSG